MNHHTLSDFRTQHVNFLDGVLTDGTAALREQELVEMDGVQRVLARMPEAEAKQRKDEKDTKDKARVSTTNPDATVMKMGDGAFCHTDKRGARLSTCSSPPPPACR